MWIASNDEFRDSSFVDERERDPACVSRVY